ncbi:MAG: GDP-mannose 4,6-dehydratase [Gemmatimonadota bacterium]
MSTSEVRSDSRAGTEGQPERVLVTGAAGFIGSHLCERLLADGHAVWALDNLDPFYSPDVKRANLETALAHPRMHFVEGDIRDGVLLDGLFGSVPFDTVVHLAARPGVRPSIEEPELCFDVNVAGTVSVLQAMRRHHVSLLLLGSSSSVYGETDEVPFREEMAADRPISPYAASKRAAELICHSYHHLYRLSVYCLRFFTVYGPRQRPDLAIHKFVRLMAAGEKIPVYGDGSSGRDYTYIDDIIEGVVRALARLRGEARSGPVFHTLNLGRSDPIQLSELVRLLGRELGIRPRVDRLPMQPGDVSITFASAENAESVLGYTPRVEIEEGVRRFVEWFRAQESSGGSDGVAVAGLSRSASR